MVCQECGKEFEDAGPCPRCGREPETTVMQTDVPVLLDNRFKVGKLIGRGGMGAVYEGVDLSLNRPVAIKYLAENLKSDRRLAERFRREAEFLASIEHRSVVPVHAVGEHDGCPYFVMRKLTGRTLAQIVRSDGPLTLAQVVHVGTELCDALRHIHGAGYIHRDIKPANTMIDHEGNCTILDFGIMRVQTSDLTSSGLIMGSPRFMAPEQGRDSRLADARSDIYALACTLFYAIVGKPPFEADTDFEMLKKHHDEPVKLPSAFDEAVPRAVDAWFERALAKRPEDRFQTAEEAGAALAALAPKAWRDTGNVAPRKRRRGMIIVATVCSVLAFATWGLVRFLVTDPSSSPPLAKPAQEPVPSLPPAAPNVAPTPAPQSVPPPAQPPPAQPQPKRRAAVQAASLRVLTIDSGAPTWAHVAVDGKVIGMSPIASHSLPAGKHELTVRREGYATVSTMLTLAPGEQRKVVLQLERTR